MLVETQPFPKTAPRSSQAFDLKNLVEAKYRMPVEQWRLECDRELQYYSREYVLRENITDFSYGIKADRLGNPLWVCNPTHPQESALASFRRGMEVEGSASLKARAAAECIGFARIEQLAVNGKGRDRFYIWHSPPGLKSDGFDTHNFTFIGQVLQDRIEAVAYKNWLSASQIATFLNQFLPQGEQFGDNPADLELLSRPVFLPKTERLQNYMDIIRALDPNRSDIAAEDNRWFLDRLQPFRRAIVSALEMEDLAGAHRAKIAHDNFAVAVLKGEDRGITGSSYWSSRPAVVLRGSCGFSVLGSGSGLSIFQDIWFFAQDKYFECPKCEGKIESGKGITVCPHCGARKEDYATCV